MNFFKKYNGKTKIELIFIGVVLTTCGIAFAISNYFKTQTKQTVKVQNKFAKLIVVDGMGCGSIIIYANVKKRFSIFKVFFYL